MHRVKVRIVEDALDANNTIAHMREERELLAGRIELPRFATDFRDRSTLVVVRGVDHQRDLRALRPFIRDLRPVIVSLGDRPPHTLELGAGYTTSPPIAAAVVLAGVLPGRA